MSFAYGQIAQRVFNTPLLYDDRKAEAFLAGLGGRIAGSQVVISNPVGAIEHTAFENGRPSAGRLGDGLGRYYEKRGISTVDVVENVAVIPIEGSLIHKGGWVGASSGETSYQGLQTQLGWVEKNRAKLKGAVFEIDSYGGEVSGAFETAAMMRRISKLMPTVAILTDFAYSAGYMMASQARQIIMPKFGGAGSIGVIMVHADYSAQYMQQGVKVTIIRSGAQKAKGNPFEPLDDRVADKWQAEVDAMRDDFADLVAMGRGRRFSKAKALATEAEPYSADDAVRLGLADAIGDPSEAFDQFIREVNRSN